MWWLAPTPRPRRSQRRTPRLPAPVPRRRRPSPSPGRWWPGRRREGSQRWRRPTIRASRRSVLQPPTARPRRSPAPSASLPWRRCRARPKCLLPAHTPSPAAPATAPDSGNASANGPAQRRCRRPASHSPGATPSVIAPITSAPIATSARTGPMASPTARPRGSLRRLATNAATPAPTALASTPNVHALQSRPFDSVISLLPRFGYGSLQSRW